MVDTCVMCDAIVPEDTQVCLRCQKSCNSDQRLCKDCGLPLRVMHRGQYTSNDGLTTEVLFHCDNCGADWSLETTYEQQVSIFKRKYWG